MLTLSGQMSLTLGMEKRANTFFLSFFFSFNQNSNRHALDTHVDSNHAYVHKWHWWPRMLPSEFVCVCVRVSEVCGMVKVIKWFSVCVDCRLCYWKSGIKNDICRKVAHIQSVWNDRMFNIIGKISIEPAQWRKSNRGHKYD